MAESLAIVNHATARSVLEAAADTLHAAATDVSVTAAEATA